MRWKDDFKQEFDLIYKIVKDEYSDIKYPCYGGRFYWFLVSRYFEELYFYLTQSRLIYTSGGYISKIPFSKIRKLSVKQGLLVKSSFHVRIVADKKYHFIIKRVNYLSTKLTGDNAYNVKLFIDTLQSNVYNKKQ